MTRRSARVFAPFAALVLVLAFRATGCRKKGPAAPGAQQKVSTSQQPYRVTALMTAPPPRPTVTLYRTDITRVPTLPE
jgi:hypothetical protein